MFKRLIVEESDGAYQPIGQPPQIQQAKPEEYEFPTRGQSMTDGLKASVWEWVGKAMVLLILAIAFLIWGC